MVVCGSDARILHANPKACSMLGRRHGRLAGVSLGDLITLPGCPGDAIPARFGAVCRGSRRRVDLRSHPLPGGGWAIFLSAPARKKPAAPGIGFAGSGDLACTLDREGRFLAVDRKWENLLGYKPGEIRGLRFGQIVLADDLALSNSFLSHSLRSREGHQAVLRIRHGDGSTRWFEWRARLHNRELWASGHDITERHTAEVALQESEAAFRSLFEACPAAVALQVDRIQLRVNGVMRRMTGYSEAEIIGKSPRINYPDDAEYERVGRELYGALTQDGFGMVEAKHRRKNGEIYDVLICASPLDPAAPTKAVVVTILDITARKRAEAALKESELFLKRSQAVGRIGSFSVDLCGVDASEWVWMGTETMEEILGIDSSYPKTSKDLAALMVDSEQVVRYFREQFLGRHRRCELQYQITRHNDGERRWLHVLAEQEFDAQGKPMRLIGTAQDITERRKTEEALQSSERKLGEIIRSSPESILISTAAEGLILDVNEIALKTLGFSREEMVGHTATEIPLWTTAADRLALLERVQREGLVRNFETKIRRKSGQIADALISATPVVLEGRECLIMLATDLTEHKRAERDRIELQRRLMQGQKLESLGILAGGIAHDFNNLLMAIMGNLELVLMDLPEKSPLRFGIDQSMTAARRATDLTRQMLAYSGRGQLAVFPVDLGPLVEENAQLFRSCVSKTASFEVKLARKLPLVNADAGQVRQVIMNLITNASEAIGARPGTITLTTGAVDLDASALSRSRLEEGAAPGRYVFFEVHDDGCGMDERTLQRLFDPFFTTKFTGRGLGMSAVLGIVRGHNGAIFVDSTPGKGSAVRILFPASTEPSPVGVQELPADSRPLPIQDTRSILVVDDEEMVRSLCCRILDQLGWHVKTAADGEEAIGIFRRHAAEIACVLLDFSMPKMDGAAVFQRLREIDSRVKVILSSGYNGQAVGGERLMVDGMVGFIQKPYSVSRLRNELTRVLRMNN